MFSILFPRVVIVCVSIQIWNGLIMVAQTTTTDIFVKVVELPKEYYFCFKCYTLKSVLKLQKDNSTKMKKRKIEVNSFFH